MLYLGVRWLGMRKQYKHWSLTSYNWEFRFAQSPRQFGKCLFFCSCYLKCFPHKIQENGNSSLCTRMCVHTFRLSMFLYSQYSHFIGIDKWTFKCALSSDLRLNRWLQFALKHTKPCIFKCTLLCESYWLLKVNPCPHVSHSYIISTWLYLCFAIVRGELNRQGQCRHGVGGWLSK